MELHVYRSVWGLADDPAGHVAALPVIAAAGYDGVCLPVQVVADPAAFREEAERHGLRCLAQVFTAGRTVDDHLRVLRDGLRRAAAFAAPFVIVQGGRDSWPEDAAAEFLDGALRIEAEEDVVVAHETHRGRVLFDPWRTDRFVERFPALRLNLDLSHWVVVAERLLNHEGGIVARCAERALHLDARVGWEEGPQVADPRLPRFAPHLEAFESWWSLVWEAHAAAGRAVTTAMPEFGPPPYQPVDPVTGEPWAPLAEVNDWMAGRLRERFAAR